MGSTPNLVLAEQRIARSRANILISRTLIASSRLLKFASVEIYLSKSKRRKVTAKNGNPQTR
jgi:hypothetical protein